MLKFYIYLLLLLASSVSLYSYESGYKNSEYANELITFASIGIPASLGALIDFLIEHGKTLFLSLRCFLFKRNESTYVSLSYLFKIKLKGSNKYLMIRGSKVRNQYQPVGGVYKKFPSLDSLWNKWEAQEAKNDPENCDDLRFEVKRKHIPEIRKWFYRRENREVDVWREFCEELLITGILPKNTFQHIKPEFLYSKEEALIFRKGKNTKQFLIYDIFSIHLDGRQELVLNELFTSAPFTEKYAFVNEEDLDKELFIENNQEHQLGYHARYLKSKSC